ncbi:hypothetical protein ABPG74_003961 [Tetrahymena malaccensis]
MSRFYFQGNCKKEESQSNYANFKLNIDEPINQTEKSDSNRSIGYNSDKNSKFKKKQFCSEDNKVNYEEEIKVELNQSIFVSENILGDLKLAQCNESNSNNYSIQELSKPFPKSNQLSCKLSKLGAIQQLKQSNKANVQQQYYASFIKQIQEKSIFFQIKLRQLVFKFSKLLQQNLESKRFSQLTCHQLSIINDKAFFFEQNLKQLKTPFIQKIDHSRDSFSRIILKIQSTLEKCDNSIINPEVWFIFLWNILLLLITLLQLFVISVRFSFDQENIPNFLNLSIIAYSLEIFLGLNTGVYKQGVLLLSRKEILKIYIKKKLLKRVFIIVMLYLSNYQKYLQLVAFLRISIINKLLKKIEQQLNINFQCYTYTKLLKLVCFLLAVAHFLACSFRLISLIESYYFTQDQIWNYKTDMLCNSLFDKYINTVYWAVVTMATLGYGDIVPLTTYERLFVIIVVLASCGLFGYSINLIGELVKDMNKDKEKYKEQIQKLEFFIKQRNMSRNLRNKVIQSFQYNFKQKHMERETSEYFLSQMNSSVRQEVSLDLYLKIFNEHKLFTQNFTSNFIKSLCDHIKEKTFFSEEYLYKKGDKSDKIFFLLEGQINLVIDDLPQMKLGSYDKKYCCIGLIEFLSQQRRKESAKIKCQTVVAYIDFEQFIKLSKILNQDYVCKFECKANLKLLFLTQKETYCFLRDTINFQQKYHQLGTQCFSCLSQDHQIDACQMIQYMPTSKKVIDKYNSNKNYLRLPFKRKKKMFSWKKNLQFDIEKFVSIQQTDQNDDNNTNQINEFQQMERANQIEGISISEQNQLISEQQSPYLYQKNESREFSPFKISNKNKGISLQQVSLQVQQIFSSNHQYYEDKNFDNNTRIEGKESPLFKGDLNSKRNTQQIFCDEDQGKTLTFLKEQSDKNTNDLRSGNQTSFVIQSFEENFLDNQNQDNIPTKILPVGLKKLTLNNFKRIQDQIKYNNLESEKCKQYEIYFSHNNISKVLIEYNTIRKKSQQYKTILQKQIESCKINSFCKLNNKTHFVKVNKAKSSKK